MLFDLTTISFFEDLKVNVVEMIICIMHRYLEVLNKSAYIHHHAGINVILFISVKAARELAKDISW